MKKLLLYIFLASLIVCSCSKKEEPVEERTFVNGFFIINTGNPSSGESASINFHSYDDDIVKFFFSDVFSEVNNETIPGFLLDLEVNNNKACLLTRDENDRLIITNKKTMRKEKEIILNSQNAKAVFLTDSEIYVITQNFIIYTINIDSEQITSTRDFSYLDGVITDVKFDGIRMYFSTHIEYGRLHMVDMNGNKPLITYNIGPHINSIVPLNDGIYVAAESPYSYDMEPTYDTSILANPNITYGIIKIDPVSNQVTQIVSTEFPYPYNLTYDDGLFLFLQSRYKFNSSNTITKFLNKVTWQESEPLKNIAPNYKTSSSIRLKDSRIYVLNDSNIHVYDLDSDLIRATVAGPNSTKIVFLD